MIIATSLETLETSMETVTSIVSDRMLQEDLKNVIVWVQGTEVRFAAYSGQIISATKVDAEVVNATEGESFHQLKAKDINDVLTTLRGLTRTKVERIELHIKDTEAVMHVHEAPLDAEIPNAESYRQVSRFRITKPAIKDLVKTEVKKIDTSVEGVVIPSGDLLIYINALYPTVAKETRESTNNVLFGKEQIYTVLAPYSAIMDNKLPEVISGFRLANTVVNFVKNFISNHDTFEIHKDVKDNGMVILTLKVDNSIALIKCADMSRAFDITNFQQLPENGIVVDKAFLIDVLKRMSLDNDAAHVNIEMNGGSGELNIASKKYTGNIPVIQSKGEGKFTFSIRSELLSSAIFSHANYFGETIFLYLENGERNNIVMGVKDNTNIWKTKMTGLSSAKGDFAWS